MPPHAAEGIRSREGHLVESRALGERLVMCENEHGHPLEGIRPHCRGLPGCSGGCGLIGPMPTCPLCLRPVGQAVAGG
jgi:hypothetical protein